MDKNIEDSAKHNMRAQKSFAKLAFAPHFVRNHRKLRPPLKE